MKREKWNWQHDARKTDGLDLILFYAHAHTVAHSKYSLRSLILRLELCNFNPIEYYTRNIDSARQKKIDDVVIVLVHFSFLSQYGSLLLASFFMPLSEKENACSLFWVYRCSRAGQRIESMIFFLVFNVLCYVLFGRSFACLRSLNSETIARACLLPFVRSMSSCAHNLLQLLL